MKNYIKIGIALLVFSTVISSMGQTLRTGDFVEVRKRAVEDGNRYFLGKTITIDGLVRGDAIAVGDNVDMNGRVTEDFHAFGRDLRTAGTVLEDVRMGGIDLFLSDSIGGDAFCVGVNLEVEREAIIDGNVQLYGMVVLIRGHIKSDLNIVADKILFEGKVDGNVNLKAFDSVTFGNKAEIGGNLICSTPEKPNVSGIMLNGEYNYEKLKASSPFLDFSSPRWLLLRLISAFIFGAVFISIFPAFMSRTADKLFPTPLPSALTGILFFFLIPIIVMFFIVVVFTIPLGLTLLVFLFFFLYLGKVVIALALGEIALAKFGYNTLSSFINLFIGLLILMVAGFIPLIGGFAVFLAELTGMGALIRRFSEIIREQRNSGSA